MTGVSTFWRLTRFNLRHLLSSPVFLAIVPLALVGLSVLSYSPALPSWADLFNQTMLQTVGVAVAMFVVTTFPAIREARHSERFALPLSSRARLLSLALASAAVTSMCVGALIALYLLYSSAPIAGVTSPFSFLGLLVLSWCGPVAAVTAAAWTRSYAPLVALVLFAPAYLLYTVTSLGAGADVVMHRLSGAASWVLNPLPVSHPGAIELALLYLLHTSLLVSFLLVSAMAARNGERALRPVSLGVAGVLLAGLFAVSLYADSTYAYETRFEDGLLHGAEAEPCRVREGVTYCSLPGYESWVDYWHAALGPAMAQVPDRARGRLPVVWQSGQDLRRDLHSFTPRGAVAVHDYWDPEDPYLREDLAVSGTVAVLGLDGDPWGSCTGTGQARIVVGAWMVSVDDQVSDAEGLGAAEYFLSRFDPSVLDLRVTHALVGLPVERVAPVVDEYWDRLLSPDTTTRELADLAGLSLSGAAEIPPPDWERSIWDEVPLLYDPEWSGPPCR